MVRVKEVAIQRRADSAALHVLIGYRHNGRFKNVRAALGESPAVLRYLMGHDPQVLKAVRKRLNEKEDARIPQYERLKDMIQAIIRGPGDSSQQCLQEQATSRPSFAVGGSRSQ